MMLATFWWAIEINSESAQNPPEEPDKGNFQEQTWIKGLNDNIEDLQRTELWATI